MPRKITAMKKVISSVLLVVAAALPAFAQTHQATGANPGKLSWHECFGYNWPKEEVRWVITEEEQTAFERLRNDNEREQFVSQFWSRRDPTPTTIANEFKDTYYERVIYANEHFPSSNEAGWRTPRGRIYIMYGQPDSLQRLSGAPRLPSSGIAVAKQCDLTNLPEGPYEVWQYLHIAGVDHPVTITFANVCKTGEMVPIADRRDAEWLSRPPVPKYKLECNGKYDPNHPPDGLQGIVCLENPPVVQFKSLEEIVSHQVNSKMVSFQVGYEFKPVTSRTVQFTIEIAVPTGRLRWENKHGDETAEVQVYGRLTTMTNKIADSFERNPTFTSEPSASGGTSEKIKIPLYLFSGRYRVDLAVRDVNADLVGTFSRAIVVPDLGSWCQ